MQVYKFVNGEVNLANQDSQFRGRTVFSGDISQGTLDLTLVGVTQNDDAVYYCRAANKMNRGDNVVVLSVIDRVSKPIIFDISTDQTIILHCVSSTINVTYKWLVNGRETETTKQTYMAPRPKEDVVVRCTVNNTVSKDSQSITIIPYKTEPGEHIFPTIVVVVVLPIVILIIFMIIIQVFRYKRCWKFKKYKRDAVEEMPHISYHPSNGRTLPDILESDCMCDENRDKIPIEGFQKTEEDQRDAAELKYTGGLRPKHDLMRISRLSLDSDYFSDQSKEASESVF
ncbi:uncharacterized protein LOC143981591 isoform X3 [Lithobates pipiens]